MADSVFDTNVDIDAEESAASFTPRFTSNSWDNGRYAFDSGAQNNSFDFAVKYKWDTLSDGVRDRMDKNSPNVPVTDTTITAPVSDPVGLFPISRPIEGIGFAVSDRSEDGGPRTGGPDENATPGKVVSDGMFFANNPAEGPGFAVSDFSQLPTSLPTPSGELPSATLPIYSNDQVAHQLTHDFNAWWGTSYAYTAFAVSPGGTLSVNITDLTFEGQTLALAALDAWTAVTGINFSTVSSGADITFDDDAGGYQAYAGRTSGSGTTTYTAEVMITTGWIDWYGTDLNSYSFQTYVHEIGHAMGLGHAGNYNGSASYAQDGSGDNHYLNDSWQASVMSYFDVNENTYIDADKLYLASPMIADILAMQVLYGTSSALRTGDTVYGEGTNVGGYYGGAIDSDRAFTIIDNGGIDTINFSSVTGDQHVDLHDETISDVGGWTGNMSIARDTVIENFYSGAGDDQVTGNEANNVIRGGSGDDFLKGQQGDDVLRGDEGDDKLRGNIGQDKLRGNDGKDILLGGSGNDLLWGGDGNDRLTGGKGGDKLIGGDGVDKFIFKADFGIDIIRDFEDNTDILRLDGAIWGDGLTEQQVIDTYAGFNAQGWVMLDFGAGDRIVFQGITDADTLVDDLVLF